MIDEYFTYDTSGPDTTTIVRRANVIRTALTLIDGEVPTDDEVDGIRADLDARYGTGLAADRKVVAALNVEYVAAYRTRVRDEKCREDFADELAARVWATVKGMTWYTDGQKVIPTDLAERVERKAKDEEEEELNELRRKLTGGY